MSDELADRVVEYSNRISELLSEKADLKAEIERLRDPDQDVEGHVFVDSVAGRLGLDWHDEFLAFYKPEEWLGSHRAGAAFVAGKMEAQKREIEQLEGELSEKHEAYVIAHNQAMENGSNLTTCESDLIKTQALVLRLQSENERLKEAFEPFACVLAMHDALPPGFKPDDNTPLRAALPGGWPTIGDLRALVSRLVKENSNG